MRYLVDTNILLYYLNSAAPEHKKAKAFLDSLIEDRVSFSLSWNIIYEFLRVATHPQIFPRPLSASQASHFMQTLLGIPGVSILSHAGDHMDNLVKLLHELHSPAGNLFHDIHTVVLMRENGLHEIITADADFLRFKNLKVINPIVD